MAELWEAAKNGDFKTVKRLVESGTDVEEPNDKGLTPFMWAVQKNRLDIAKFLIEHGAKVSATNNYSLSPLMWAVVNSPNLAIIKFLLENGADVNEKSEAGVHGEESDDTPLMRAVYCRRPGNVMYNRAKLLIEYGADINAKDSDGRTVLIRAAWGGNLDVIKLLIEKGLDVNAKDNDGWTSLMYAATRGNLDVVKLLVEKGAKLDAQDDEGKTALMLAEENKRPNVAKFLREQGAKAGSQNIKISEQQSKNMANDNSNKPAEASGPNYWWLNANPKKDEGWNLSSAKVGDVQAFSSVGKKNNRPNVDKVKRGDIVIGYQTGGPLKKGKKEGCEIAAICEILGEHDDVTKEIQIVKVKDVKPPISLGELRRYLKERPELIGGRGPFARNKKVGETIMTGTLLKLSKDCYDFVMDLIRKRGNGEPSVNPELEKLKEQHFQEWLKLKEEHLRAPEKYRKGPKPPKNPDKPSPTPVISNDNKGPKYWWLNIPFFIDGPKNFTLLDPDEKDDRDLFKVFRETFSKPFLEAFRKSFNEANVGDKVYLSDPSGSLVAICKIDEKQKKKIQIVDEKTLLRDIALAKIKRLEGEKEIELPTHQGTLCALTEEQVGRIKGVIKKKLTEDSQSTTSVIDPEQKKKLIEEFLSEVYLGKTKDEGKEKYAMLESLLETKKNIILQGPPGVGKTFAATRLAYSLLGLGLQELKEHGNKDPRIQFVQFHQSYSYEDFVMGYKPTGDGFKLQEGIFYKFCKEAQKKEEAYKENPKDTGSWYFLIIDEINRGNTSRIFGELLMLIENGYRGKKHAITLAYEDKAEQDSSEKEDKRFYVPENLFIIGMMNTADRSLAMLDYALRRRFAFFDMEPAFDSDRFEEYQKGLSNTDFGKLIDAVKTLNEKIADDKSLGEGFCIGHSYFCNWKGCTKRKMRNAVWYDILPLLREYYFDNQTKYAERLEPLYPTGLLPEEDKEKFEAWDAKQKPKNGQVATPVATTPPATPAAPTNQVTSA